MPPKTVDGWVSWVRADCIILPEPTLECHSVLKFDWISINQNLKKVDTGLDCSTFSVTGGISILS